MSLVLCYKIAGEKVNFPLALLATSILHPEEIFHMGFRCAAIETCCLIKESDLVVERFREFIGSFAIC